MGYSGSGQRFLAELKGGWKSFAPVLNLMFSLFNKNPKSNYATNLLATLKDAQFKEHFMV